MSARWWGWLAIVAVVYHAVAMIALHLLVPEVDPARTMVGAYLTSPYRFLSRTTFLALGCALIALVMGLRPVLLTGRLRHLVTVLLGIAVLGFLGVAAFPGAARPIAVVTQPATVLAIVVLSWILRKEPPWSSVGTALLVVAGLLFALFVATIVTGFLVARGLGGLANRVVLVLIYTWIVLVASRLARKTVRDPSSTW